MCALLAMDSRLMSWCAVFLPLACPRRRRAVAGEGLCSPGGRSWVMVGGPNIGSSVYGAVGCFEIYSFS